jgi:hypothetical protein
VTAKRPPRRRGWSNEGWDCLSAARGNGRERSHAGRRRFGATIAEWDESPLQRTESTKTKICMVPRGGVEPPTLRFSVACSTS